MAMVNSYTEVMPTPHRTSVDEIVGAARDILEREGLAGLTMQAVAQRVGVRAPSLYKRVQGRDDLVRLVAEATLTELAGRLGGDDLRALAATFRSFAHEHPVAFQLVMAPGAHVPRARAEFLAAASDPLLRVAAGIAGPQNALAAARTVTAWANGFITMELSGGFNLGGDVDAAWHYGVERLIEAIDGP